MSFSIGSPSSGFESTTDGTGTAGASVPSGDTYTIAEETPEGHGSARVFCSYYDQAGGPGEYAEIEAPGNSVVFDIEAGFSLECYWFNVPAVTGQIEVTKFECPQGYGTGTTFDQLTASCQTVLSGVTFTLSPAEGEETQLQTDGAGQILFTDVPL